jgi:hypothetical protein
MAYSVQHHRCHMQWVKWSCVSREHATSSIKTLLGCPLLLYQLPLNLLLLHSDNETSWFGTVAVHNLSSYSRINYITSPALGAGTVSEPRLTSQVRRVREDQCVSAVTAVEVPVLVCLLSSCSHVTGVCETHAEGCHAKWWGLCGCNHAIPYLVSTTLGSSLASVLSMAVKVWPRTDIFPSSSLLA